jgi:hypothetical protein
MGLGDTIYHLRFVIYNHIFPTSFKQNVISCLDRQNDTTPLQNKMFWNLKACLAFQNVLYYEEVLL